MLIYFLIRSKAAGQFRYLIALLGVRFACSVVCLPLLYLCGRNLISIHIAYPIYFYTYWASYALEAILSLMVIYSIFKLAMAPLKGLQTLGMLVFRWVAAISVAVAIGVAVTPHLSGVKFMTAMITQSVEQARGAMTNYFQFLQKSMSASPWAGADQTKTLRSYAERNVADRERVAGGKPVLAEMGVEHLHHFAGLRL